MCCIVQDLEGAGLWPFTTTMQRELQQGLGDVLDTSTTYISIRCAEMPETSYVDFERKS